MEWKNLFFDAVCPKECCWRCFRNSSKFAVNTTFLISILHYNKGFRFLLCVIDIYSKYAWIIPLKDKKRITITTAFQEILDESNCKPNKMWVDKSSESCNKSMKSFLQNNGIQIFSSYNKGESVIAEWFIRTLNIKK